MITAHKIVLDPNPAQENYFARACGTARFAYNWALAEWNRQYESGLRPALCWQRASSRLLGHLADEGGCSSIARQPDSRFHEVQIIAYAPIPNNPGKVEQAPERRLDATF